MKRRILILGLGLAAVLAFVLFQTLYIVRVGESAVVTTFGRPVSVIEDPGLYTRWPWPVQRVHVLDARIQCMEGAFEETYTMDHRNLIVMVYAGWRVREPLKFLQRVGSAPQAEQNLEGLIRHYKNGVFGRHVFSDFVNTNRAALRFEAVEQEILDPVRSEASERYGIDVVLLGIRKIALPETITASVFERMRSERKVLEDRIRSEGEAEAIRVRADAGRRRDELLARAEAKAKGIRAEGDAEAARQYAVFEKNPELAIFLRKLDALEETLKEKAVVVLGDETAPFDLFRDNAVITTNRLLPGAVKTP